MNYKYTNILFDNNNFFVYNVLKFQNYGVFLMYFDFFVVNEWAYTNRISVNSVYKLYTDPSYNINHRVIDKNKYILLFTMHGKGEVCVDEQTWQVGANDLIIANATHKLSYRCIGDVWNLWLFEFKMDDLGLIPNHLYNTPFKKEYFDLTNTILHYLKIGKQVLSSAYFQIFYRMFYDCICVSLKKDKAVENLLLGKSIEYMKDNLQNFSVSELSSYLNVSTRTVEKLFQKHCHTSPIDYYQSIRLEYSKQYLESTEYSITEIASLLGYSNSGHFSSSFKKYFHSTPTKYRTTSGVKNDYK